MKRRETLRTLLVGTIGGVGLASSTGCVPEPTATDADATTPETFGLYGRTPDELEHDQEVLEEEYLNAHELATIATLCDIILPATDTAPAASEAEVADFIAFMVKDIPAYQVPIRGGLMWLDGEANRRFNKEFIACTPEEELQLVDDIAYPDPDEERPAMGPGISFFNLMRNMCVTGYYTTKIGFDDLGVNSNYANTWDGVPAEVLADHDVDYEPEWLAKCIDQSQRMTIAEWDEEGNLLT